MLPLGWASAAVLLTLLAHLKFIARPHEWQLLLLTMFIGGVVDTVLAAAGIFTFTAAGTFWPQNVIPLWLLLLWANFATTLCHSLSWLRQYPIIAFGLGGIAGPLAYLGGSKITDKLIITQSLPGFAIALAVAWAVLCLLLPYLAERLVIRRAGVDNVHTPAA